MLGELGAVDEHGRDHDEAVALQAPAHRDDVGGDPGLPQAAVPGAGRLEALADLDRADGGAQGPLALPVQDEGRLGLHRFPQHRPEACERLPGGRGLLPGATVAPGVGDHAGVEGLGALAGLSPLELQDAVGAVGHAGQGPQEELAGALGRVAPAPLDGAGRLLHEDPGAPLRQAPHEVTGPGDLVGGGRVGGVGVGVVGDDVEGLGPAPVVSGREVAHEVGGHRPRRALPQDTGLGLHEAAQLVVAEAPPVQHLGGVGEGGHGTERGDLLQARIALGPEVGGPGGVEALDVAVALTQPGPEGLGAGGAEALGGVAAVLVADVPHDDARVVAQALGQGRGQGGGALPVDGGAGAVLLARPQAQAHAVGVHRQGLGVVGGHPGGRGGGGGGQVDGDARLVETVDDLHQPVELVDALARLEARPGEDA